MPTQTTQLAIPYLLALMLLFSGCSLEQKPDYTLEQARVDYQLLHTLPEKPIRSHTPPGKPVEEIASVRPTDDPGSDTFFYRLQRYHPSIVAKDHVVYTLSNQRG